MSGHATHLGVCQKSQQHEQHEKGQLSKYKESCVQSQSPHLHNGDDSPDATPTGVLKSRSGTRLHQARTQLSSVNQCSGRKIDLRV